MWRAPLEPTTLGGFFRIHAHPVKKETPPQSLKAGNVVCIKQTHNILYHTREKLLFI